MYYVTKDWCIKKETKVDVNISINFSHILTNFVPQKIQILIAFLRGALFYFTSNLEETGAFLVKLVRNWNLHKIVGTFFEIFSAELFI